MATPVSVKHCVAKLAPKYGGDTKRAFAICVSAMQKAGLVKPGTLELTSKGKEADKRHRAEKDAELKLKRYEKHLEKAREKTAKKKEKEKMKLAAQRIRSKAPVLERYHELAGNTTKERPWSIEEARRYCLDDEKLEESYDRILRRMRYDAGIVRVRDLV